MDVGRASKIWPSTQGTSLRAPWCAGNGAPHVGSIHAAAAARLSGDVADIQAVRKDRARFPSSARAVGRHRSLTSCPASDGTTIDMSKMTRVVTIDERARTITAEAGLQCIDANTLLRERSLQFLLSIEIGNLTLPGLLDVARTACFRTRKAIDEPGHVQADTCRVCGATARRSSRAPWPGGSTDRPRRWPRTPRCGSCGCRPSRSKRSAACRSSMPTRTIDYRQTQPDIHDLMNPALRRPLSSAAWPSARAPSRWWRDEGPLGLRCGARPPRGSAERRRWRKTVRRRPPGWTARRRCGGGCLQPDMPTVAPLCGDGRRDQPPAPTRAASGSKARAPQSSSASPSPEASTGPGHVLRTLSRRRG